MTDINTLLEKVVAEQWRAGMGANTLFQKVHEILLKDENVEVTKPQVKAAKLMIPYTMEEDNDKSGKSNALPEEKINFINQKIIERQRYRQLRKFKDADYIQRGLVKMGVLMDDANKTWMFRKQDDNFDSETDFEKLTSQADKMDIEDEPKDMLRCEMCGKLFKSRNLIFKHLRDPGSDCGNSIFANNQALPVAPSTKKKIEKKKAVNSGVIRSRARTGKTAIHSKSSSTLWVGDLPLTWTRAGGQYKRLRALIRQYVPRAIPQPWIKLVVRKAYRKRSGCKDVSNDEGRVKDEYLGYAIIVFRCDEEAEIVRKSLDGLEVCPKYVFRQHADDSTDGELPIFVLKVKAADNGDSRIMPKIKQSGQDPPLIEQLRPFTNEELKKRITCLKKIRDFDGIEFNEEKKSSEENPCLEVDTLSKIHHGLLNQAVQLYESIGPRMEKRSHGRAVPENLTQPLLEILSTLRWKVPNERPHINAERYLVLPTNITNDRFYGDLRDACRELMKWTDSSYYYSGIAVVRQIGL